MTASKSYKNLLDRLSCVDRGPSPRGMATKELIACQTRVDMHQPIILIPDRKLDYAFMAAEAWWVLTGQSILATQVIRRNLQKYSDTDYTMSGAYGPMFIEQYRYIVEKLIEDRDTRQAVMTFWRKNPRDSKDIPCTVSLQFLIRDDRLHLHVCMRSSDAWLGWPYDVFTFTMIAAFIGVCYNKMTLTGWLELGELIITAGSQHLYERHWDVAEDIIKSKNHGIIKDITIHGQISPVQLVDELRCAFDCPNKGAMTIPVLRELHTLIHAT